MSSNKHHSTPIHSNARIDAANGLKRQKINKKQRREKKKKWNEKVRKSYSKRKQRARERERESNIKKGERKTGAGWQYVEWRCHS